MQTKSRVNSHLTVFILDIYLPLFFQVFLKSSIMSDVLNAVKNPDSSILVDFCLALIG